MVNNSPSLSNRIRGGVVCSRVGPFSLSLFLWSSLVFLVFDRGFRGVAKKTRGNVADGAERERERSPSSSSFVTLLALLNAIRWHENWGRKNVEHNNARFMNTGTNDFDVRFLSPFTKFSLLRIEANGRETKEGLALARSFVRVTQ